MMNESMRKIEEYYASLLKNFNKILTDVNKDNTCEKVCNKDQTVDPSERVMHDLIYVFYNNVDKYNEFVKTINPAIADILEIIAQDIREANTVDIDEIQKYVERLKDGETLELDESVIDEVVDRLWETEDKVYIEVRDNKIRLK